MTKNRYTDVTNSKPLTVLVIFAIIVVLVLVLSYGGVSILGVSVPGDSSSSGGAREQEALAAAQVIGATETAVVVVQAHAQAKAEESMQETSTAVSVSTTEVARSIEVARTAAVYDVESTAVVNRNATSTAYPPTATAQAVKDAQDAEWTAREGQATANAWAMERTIQEGYATATEVHAQAALADIKTRSNQRWVVLIIVPVSIGGIGAAGLYVWTRLLIMRNKKKEPDQHPDQHEFVVGVGRQLQQIDDRIAGIRARIHRLENTFNNPLSAEAVREDNRYQQQQQQISVNVQQTKRGLEGHAEDQE